MKKRGRKMGRNGRREEINAEYSKMGLKKLEMSVQS
jgi:hypothetical protein